MPNMLPMLLRVPPPSPIFAADDVSLVISVVSVSVCCCEDNDSVSDVDCFGADSSVNFVGTSVVVAVASVVVAAGVGAFVVVAFVVVVVVVVAVVVVAFVVVFVVVVVGFFVVVVLVVVGSHLNDSGSHAHEPPF